MTLEQPGGAEISVVGKNMKAPKVIMELDYYGSDIIKALFLLIGFNLWQAMASHS